MARRKGQSLTQQLGALGQLASRPGPPNFPKYVPKYPGDINRAKKQPKSHPPGTWKGGPGTNKGSANWYPEPRRQRV